MSSLLSPIGPEPPTVYWIRRAAIILVILTVLVGVWWLLGSLRGGSADPAATASDPSSASASASPSPQESDPQASAEASTEPTKAEIVACPDSVILVEASTDASTYPVGSSPKLTLSITNTGDVPCKRDVGPRANELSISSGGYHVWSSDDCDAGKDRKVVTMKPGEPFATSIAWDARLSQKGCPDPEGAAAKAGRYDLEGRNGKVTSESVPFALTNKS